MSKKAEIDRRKFLKSGAKVGVGLAAFRGLLTARQPERVLGANDRIQVAVVGVHGQGFAHVREYAKMRDVSIGALCDVDENVLRQRLGEMEKMGLPKPKTYTDYRKLLEDKSIDAVSIAVRLQNI
jgi:hypothetical protein